MPRVSAPSARGRRRGDAVFYCWLIAHIAVAFLLVASVGASLQAPLAAVALQSAVLPGELAAVDRGAWAADAAPLMLSFTHEESGAALSVPTFRPGHNDKPFRGIYN